MEKLCNLGVFSASRYLGSAINCHTNILGAILIQFLATWGDFAYHRPQPPTPRTCSRNHWPEIVLGNFNAEALIQILPILTCLYCSTNTDSCYLDLSICSMTTTSETRLTYNCAHLRSTKESLTFEYEIWWYWVSRRRYWLVLGGIGSLWSGTGIYLMVLGQFRVVLVDI